MIAPILNFFKRRRVYRAAVEAAMQLCRQMHPNEPIINAFVHADEPDRFVVIVLYGEAEEPPPGFHPRVSWLYQLTVAVDIAIFDAAPIVNDEAYWVRLG